MHIIQINGDTHYVCIDREEMNRVWKKHPEARGKIWLTEEIRRLMLAGPEEVAAEVKKKRTVPGYVWKAAVE